jgi:ABC-type amino acid transport substrate-binding protein
MPLLVAVSLSLGVAGSQVAAPDAPAGGAPSQEARLRSVQSELHVPASAPALDHMGVLRVGTCDLPPWSIVPDKPGAAWTGVAVHLVREVAEALNLKVEVHTYSYPQLLAAVEKGEIDIAATGIPITADNLARFAMTPAFDESGLSIATRTRPRMTFFSTLEHVATREVLMWGASLAVACVVFGALLWLVERKRNPPFEGDAGRGLAEASWWSVVTMFTVGYGDRVPVTLRGKLLAVVWMGLAFVLITVASGLVTSTLTVQQLRPVVASARDLSGARVGCVAESEGQRFLEAAKIRFIAFPTYEAGLQALEKMHLDAVVGSTVALEFLVTRSDDHALTVLGQALQSDYVGFGMRYGLSNGLEKRFELEMLKVSQSEEFRGYRDTLLGRSMGMTRQ